MKKGPGRYFNYKGSSYKISDKITFLDEAFQEPGELQEHLEHLRKEGNDIFEDILFTLEQRMNRVQDEFSKEQEEYQRAEMALRSISNVRYFVAKNDASEAVLQMFFTMVEIISIDSGIVFEGLAREIGRSRGGKASKKSLLGVKKLIKTVLDEHGYDLIWRKAWKIIERRHTSEKPFMSDDGYEIYIDGKRIFQVNDSTGVSRSIGEEAFKKYLSEIKKVKKMK